MSASEPRASVSTRGPVLIVGTGLLGTSLALALRAAGVEVLLSDTSPTSLALARDMGAGTLHGKDSPEPQIVVVATPPDVTADVVVAQLSAHPSAVVTDVASVKERVVSEVRSRAGDEARRYVGSHPMAGRERSGAGAADCDLFAGRPWVVVGQDSDPQAELVIRNLAVDVGATPVRMGAAEHDAAVAAVSHMPHLAAFAYVHQLFDHPNGKAYLKFAATGFQDFTRTASSHPAVWADICLANRDNLLELIRGLGRQLDTLVTILLNRDRPSLYRYFEEAKATRDGWSNEN